MWRIVCASGDAEMELVVALELELWHLASRERQVTLAALANGHPPSLSLPLPLFGAIRYCYSSP